MKFFLVSADFVRFYRVHVIHNTNEIASIEQLTKPEITTTVSLQ